MFISIVMVLAGTLIVGNFIMLVIACSQQTEVFRRCDRIYERSQAQRKAKVDLQTATNT
jgi:hypothetical protein